MPPPPLTRTIHFGSFTVTPQVFHLTPLSFALVNIKPILPGHVLVSPLRVVPRFTDLTPAEVSDLFAAVQTVSRMVSRVFRADALNIAIQDGAAAGQSVPHVHTHIIPRHDRDMDHRGGSDAVYHVMQSKDGDVGEALRDRDRGRGGESEAFGVDDEKRVPRTDGVMREEAEWLACEMDAELEALD